MTGAGVREIPLTRGFVALVDADDYERVMAAGSWCSRTKPHTTYAAKSIRRTPGAKQTSLYLHTFLTGWPMVDHRNGNGLDNRRANLRPATSSQNSANQKLRSNNTSGYRGVQWNKKARKWRAQIVLHGKRRILGDFTSKEDAARAYDAAAVELFGEYARPNFSVVVTVVSSDTTAADGPVASEHDTRQLSTTPPGGVR